MQPVPDKPLIAIACGGTGGHLFPGLAVAEELQRRDCDVLLLVSPKEVDQQAVRAVRDLQVATLPAVALQGNLLAFARASTHRAALPALLPRRRIIAAIAIIASPFTSWTRASCGGRGSRLRFTVSGGHTDRRRNKAQVQGPLAIFII